MFYVYVIYILYICTDVCSFRMYTHTIQDTELTELGITWLKLSSGSFSKKTIGLI